MNKTLESLLKEDESEYLDFKVEWHTNNKDLIHDILCLSNAITEHNERYLIIGIEDKTKNIIGVNNDKNRKNTQNINDTMIKNNFNACPSIKVETITIECKEIDIITITPNKRHLPYYIQKYNNNKIPHGAIYVRNKDTNTPIDQNALSIDIECLWKTRFGLDLSPLEKIERYLMNTDDWEISPTDETNKTIFYYKLFPEFTLEIHNEEYVDYGGSKSFSFFGHTLGSSCDAKIYLKYRTTFLSNYDMVVCDNHRYYIILPECDWVYYNPQDKKDLQIFANNNVTVSDKGKKIAEIDCIQGKGIYKQCRIGYYKENTTKHLLQKILTKHICRDDILNKDTNYSYTDPQWDDENKDIITPSKIYLIAENEDITKKLESIFITNCIK